MRPQGSGDQREGRTQPADFGKRLGPMVPRELSLEQVEQSADRGPDQSQQAEPGDRHVHVDNLLRVAHAHFTRSQEANPQDGRDHQPAHE